MLQYRHDAWSPFVAIATSSTCIKGYYGRTLQKDVNAFVWVSEWSPRLSKAMVACHHFATSGFRYSRRSYGKRPKWLIPASAFPSQDRTSLFTTRSLRIILQDRNNARGIALSQPTMPLFPRVRSRLFSISTPFSSLFFLFSLYTRPCRWRNRVSSAFQWIDCFSYEGENTLYINERDRRDRRED